MMQAWRMDCVEATSCSDWEGLVSAIFSLAQRSELLAGFPAELSPTLKRSGWIREGEEGPTDYALKANRRRKTKGKKIADQNTFAFLYLSVMCKPGLALVLVCSFFLSPSLWCHLWEDDEDAMTSFNRELWLNCRRTLSLWRAKDLIRESLNVISLT